MSNERKVIETLFQIQDKSGITVDYKLNPAQAMFDDEEAWPPYRGTLVVKARQKGFSSIILAKFTVRCLSKPGTHAVVLSHESESTQRLFEKVHFYLDYLKGPKAELDKRSKMGMSFPKTRSTYYIGTAGARAFGRGDFITDLHCSEYAWWEAAATRHLAGLFQAVPDPSGRIYIESTGNGQDNDFYYMYKHHEKLRYKLVFYAWWMDDEYRLRWPYKEPWKPELHKFMDHLLLTKERFNLCDDQMYWYEAKLVELRENLPLMMQEYPSEPEEAFQATGGSVFGTVPYQYLPVWEDWRFDDQLCRRLQGRPRPEFHYVIGADPSGGTGHDDTAAVVFEVETLEQVFALNNKYLEPIAFADMLKNLGNLYNEAYIVCEGNNHGIAVNNLLKRIYPKGKIFQQRPGKYGFQNSTTTRPQMIGLLKEMIDDGLVIHDVETRDELAAFHEDVEGKPEGEHDNLCLACCLAAVGLMKKIKYRWAYNEPAPEAPLPSDRDKIGSYMYFKLDDILDDIKKRKRGNPWLERSSHW